MTHTAREFLHMLLQLSTHFQIKCIPHVCTLYSSRTVECRTKFLCKQPSRYIQLLELQEHITRNTLHATIFVRILEILNKQLNQEIEIKHLEASDLPASVV
jgi:hypothetical protein